MKRRLYLIVTIFIMVTGFCAAESVWEGNASMSMYGEFPQKGFYAASNSFARNTLVEVENLNTGKKGTVIIVDRLSEPGLFLLLSREASQELGIKQDELVRVRVTLAYPENGAVSLSAQDSPYHPDPDVNPSAAVTGDYTVPEKARTAEEIVEETAETAEEISLEDIGPEPDEGPLSASLAAVIDIPEAPSENGEKEQPEGEAEKPPKERVKFLGVTDLASSPREEEYSFEQPDMPQEPAVAAAPLEEEAGESAQRIVPETPEVEELTDSPRMGGIALLDLDIPQEPEETEETEKAPAVVVEEPEETEARAAGGPQVSGLEESPRIEEIGLYAMDIPEVPEREEKEGAGPEVTELAASPESPGVGPVASLAVPVEPTPEIVDLEAEEPEEKTLAGKSSDLPGVVEPEPVEAAEKIEAEADVPAFDEDAEIVLRPAEPRPPKPAARPTYEQPTAEPSEKPYRFETTGMLARDSYYVQLGVYSEPRSVEQVVSSLSPTFPITVYEPSRMQYKVLLGPLNQDESGSVLFTIKARGYTDAFIRRGN